MFTRLVVVMDNARFHKWEGILKAIEDHRSIVQLLPADSSDVNSVEKKWTPAKAIEKPHRGSVYELFS